MDSVPAQIPTSTVTMSSVYSGKGQVNTTVSWPPVPGASSYELKMTIYNTRPLFFNATAVSIVP